MALSQQGGLQNFLVWDKFLAHTLHAAQGPFLETLRGRKGEISPLRASLRGTKQPLHRTIKKLNANGNLTAAYWYDEIRGTSKFYFFLELDVRPAQLPRRLLLLS